VIETLRASSEDITDCISFSSQSLSQNDLSHQNATDTEDDDFLLFEDNLHESQNNNDSQKIVSDYILNPNIKSPNDLPASLKTLYIEYNTAVPSSAHVERLFSAGGQLYSRRRGSMSDTYFEMALLLKFNKYFIQ